MLRTSAGNSSNSIEVAAVQHHDKAIWRHRVFGWASMLHCGRSGGLKAVLAASLHCSKLPTDIAAEGSQD